MHQDLSEECWDIDNILSMVGTFLFTTPPSPVDAAIDNGAAVKTRDRKRDLENYRPVVDL